MFMRFDLNSMIVSSEIIAIIMLSIVCISVFAEKEKGKRNNAFIFCVLFTITTLILEIFNYILEGNPDNTLILYFTNYGFIVAGEGVLFFFTKYAFECVNDKKRTNRMLLIVVSVLCCIDFLIQTIGVLTGTSFQIIDAKFVSYTLYSSSFILIIIVLIIVKVFLVKNKRYIGRYHYNVFSLNYIVLGLSAISIMIYVELSFLPQLLSLSLLIMYVGIEKQEKENLLIRLVNSDALTGLLNRNAWNIKIEDVKNNKGEICVVYADLNNLKYTNDNLGHLEGDKLISKFTNILKSIFINDNIYRVGGDEFVIIVDSDVNAFEYKIESFKEIVIKNDYIASFGYDKGDASDVDSIVKKAEQGMYQDKNEYYIRTGKDRRRRR